MLCSDCRIMVETDRGDAQMNSICTPYICNTRIYCIKNTVAHQQNSIDQDSKFIHSLFVQLLSENANVHSTQPRNTLLGFTDLKAILEVESVCSVLSNCTGQGHGPKALVL